MPRASGREQGHIVIYDKTGVKFFLYFKLKLLNLDESRYGEILETKSVTSMGVFLGVMQVSLNNTIPIESTVFIGFFCKHKHFGYIKL